MGTVAAATTECGWKRGDTDTGHGQSSRKPFRGNSGSGRERDCGKGAADGALEARMRRCLKLRQGASPLRPPAPFPSNWIIRKGGSLSRVRYAGQKRGALDRLPPFRTKLARQEGKGALGGAAFVGLPLVGSQPGHNSRPSPREKFRGSWRARDSGKGEADSALEARMRRCLKLRQGASPLRPPRPRRNYFLD